MSSIDTDKLNSLCDQTKDLEEFEIGSTGSVDSLENFKLDSQDFEEEIKKRQKCKRGVVYISYLPPGMNPTILRRLLSQYAHVERMYLLTENKGKKKKRGSKYPVFTEGWVEFLKKRDAKKIAAMLNNSPMGGKKKSKFREYLWNLKYLPRFKWVHLTERLNYERAVKQQRLRAEVSQARKMANHFSENVAREEMQKRWKGAQSKKKSPAAQSQTPVELLEKRFPQRDVKGGKDKKESDEKRQYFLKNLFG